MSTSSVLTAVMLFHSHESLRMADTMVLNSLGFAQVDDIGVPFLERGQGPEVLHTFIMAVFMFMTRGTCTEERLSVMLCIRVVDNRFSYE